MASILLHGGTVVDVLSDKLELADVLMEDGVITAVEPAGTFAIPRGTTVVDVSGKYLCPGFIDGHIHIESTLMVPRELARVCAAHGTAAIVADPHEIANVAGAEGLRYMLETSRGLPMDIFFALPSCVPATPYDESGATLTAADLKPFYAYPEVVALGEVMNVPSVLNGDADMLQKIADAKAAGRVVNGHAPGVLGDDLRNYIAAGINDDHECSTFEEAHERIEAGMWVMIREGSAARNLEALLPLFDAGYNRRCLLVTDDKHADDLLGEGHIDAIIRAAVRMGADPLVAVRMGTIQAARCLNLPGLGAIAPGFTAHIVAVEDLKDFRITDVWHAGEAVAVHLDAPNDFVNEPLPSPEECASPDLERAVRHTFNMDLLSPDSFIVNPSGREKAPCRVIVAHPGTLITDCTVQELDFTRTNGTAPELDVAKIAVCERHHRTGHVGLGFISGLGLRHGAVASSVSHDTHNLIVVGTNEDDMALVANTVLVMGGGRAVASGGHLLACMGLPIAGLMSDLPAEEVASESAQLDAAIRRIGCAEGIDPIMNMAFSSLTVIPHMKMTTLGPFDVDAQHPVSLFVEDGED